MYRGECTGSPASSKISGNVTFYTARKLFRFNIQGYKVLELMIVDGNLPFISLVPLLTLLLGVSGQWVGFGFCIKIEKSPKGLDFPKTSTTDFSLTGHEHSRFIYLFIFLIFLLPPLN